MRPSRFHFIPAVLIVIACVGGGVRAQAVVDWTQPTGGVSVATDYANNVFTVNYTQALGAEMTLTKRDVLGNLVWTASYDQTDATKWERASWVTTDSAGNAIVCGTMMSGYSNPVRAASIAMKWSPGGTLLWRHVYESSFDGSYTVKCLVDAADDVYVFGAGSGPSGFVSKVKKFAADGTVGWSYFDTDGIGVPHNFKFSRDGNLLLVGRSIFGSLNGYAKIDLAGSRIWGLAGVNSITVGDAAGDAAGNTYVVHGNYPSTGTAVRKLGPGGLSIWQQSFPSTGMRVEVGTDELPVVAGFPTSGAGAAFFKVSDSGSLVWANLDADGPLALLLHAQLIVDASNDAYLAAGTLFAMAVCKVRADGSSAWTVTTPGSYAFGIALGQHESAIYVVGGNTARILDPEEGPWEDLGSGLAGGAGLPHLFGVGTLAAGTPFSLHVIHAAPIAAVTFVAGTSTAYAPMFGGVLVPLPEIVVGGFTTDAAGTLVVPGAWPAGLAAGSTFFIQAGIADPGAPMGVSATNGLKLTTP